MPEANFLNLVNALHAPIKTVQVSEINVEFLLPLDVQSKSVLFSKVI